MQEDLIKKDSQKIIYHCLRVGFLKLEFQITKSGTPREGDTSSRLLERCILWFILLLSIVLRISLYKIQSRDYSIYLQPWYDYIQTHGGFAALKDNFSDYNPAYLYLLAWATYLPVQPIVAIKTISVVFDLVIALFTYLILRLKYPHSSIPTIGAVVILFAPTLFLNSAAWGQCDATYTAFCLGSLYCLLSERPAWACLFFGLAISFKLQAIFFLPVLIVLLVTRKLPLKSLMLIPVVYVALLAPALLAGRDAWSLLTIYVGQANEFSGALTLGAPTFYQWIPTQAVQDWSRMGMILASMMVAFISFLTMTSRKPITADIILKLTLVFALGLPFLLPNMHERYFYLADVVSIIYAFCFPSYFYVAVIEQLCSLLSYTSYLFGTQVLNLAYIALAVLFLLVVMLTDLVKMLYPNIHLKAVMPIASRNDLSSKGSDHVLSTEVSSDMDSSKILNDGLSSGVSGVSSDIASSRVLSYDISSEISNDIGSSAEKKVKEDIPVKGTSIVERQVTRRMPLGNALLGSRRTFSMTASLQIGPVKREAIERYWFWLLLLGILLLASILRLYALDVYPQRFNQDEMILGYDAWSIWTTGHDHHGALFPVFFRTFNDYVPPVANYIAAPFVGTLGLSEFSTRLPFALMGIATVFFVALLGRRWFNAAAGLLAAFLLTIDPWHINYSRIAFPVSCVPFFTVVALYCFTRGTSLFAMEGQRPSTALLWLARSALSFALLTSTYSTMKLEGPFLLCACAIAVLPLIWNKLSRLRWADIFIWLVLYGLFVSPLALAEIRDWNQAQSRFNAITILTQPHWLSTFFTYYANAYNPAGLFFTGFGNGVQVLPQGVGQLFWLEWPLWIFAIMGISQQRFISCQVGFVLSTLLVIWFVTYPIASSLTFPSPHEIRTYNFLPLPEILAGYGAVVAWEMGRCYRWKWFSAAQGALAISVMILVIFNVLFLNFFFSAPLLQTDATADQIPYNVGLRPVLTTVMQQVKPCDTVWLEPTNQTYIYFLFLTRYPSSLFPSTAQEVDSFFQNNYGSVGQMHFGTPDDQRSTVSLPAVCEGKPSRLFFITRKAQVEPGWQHIIAVSNHADVLIWQALVKTYRERSLSTSGSVAKS